jgi:hypothetical protein
VVSATGSDLFPELEEVDGSLIQLRNLVDRMALLAVELV